MFSVWYYACVQLTGCWTGIDQWMSLRPIKILWTYLAESLNICALFCRCILLKAWTYVHCFIKLLNFWAWVYFQRKRFYRVEFVDFHRLTWDNNTTEFLLSFFLRCCLVVAQHDVCAVVGMEMESPGLNTKSKGSDDSQSNAKLQNSCQLCLLNTHQLHKVYCARSF